MKRFGGLFDSRDDDTVYVSDGFGRLGEGRRVRRRDPFGRVLPDERFDDFRNAWKRDRDPVSLFGGRPFALDGSIGTDADNRRADVAKLETGLGLTGHLDLDRTEGPTGYPSTRLVEATKRFQRDNNLKMDGLVTPGGPTIRTLERRIGEGRPGFQTMERRAGDSRIGNLLERTAAGEARSGPDSGSAAGGDKGPDVKAGASVPPADAAHDAWWRGPELSDNERADKAERQMRNFRDEFERQGMPVAAGNLDWYLTAGGADKEFTREQMRAHQPILDAEQENRKRFETGTFIGKTENNPAPRELKEMKDGGPPKKFTDEWNSSYGLGGFLADAAAGDRDFAGAFGRTNVLSSGEFTAERKGDEIRIEGTVTHRLARRDEDTGKLIPERYNFDKFQPGSVQAGALEPLGKGHPFNIRAEWKEKVSGTVRIENGRLGEPKFTWEDVD